MNSSNLENRPSLAQYTEEIKSLVRESGTTNSTILDNGTTIMVVYNPEKDVVAIAETTGGHGSRKHRDRQWRITEPQNQSHQERHVLRRDNRRGDMEIR